MKKELQTLQSFVYNKPNPKDWMIIHFGPFAILDESAWVTPI